MVRWFNHRRDHRVGSGDSSQINNHEPIGAPSIVQQDVTFLSPALGPKRRAERRPAVAGLGGSVGARKGTGGLVEGAVPQSPTIGYTSEGGDRNRKLRERSPLMGSLGEGDMSDYCCATSCLVKLALHIIGSKHATASDVESRSWFVGESGIHGQVQRPWREGLITDWATQSAAPICCR